MVSEFKRIAKRYAKKSFFFDLIAWIPFDLFVTMDEVHLLRIIKMLRISRLFELLDVEKFKGLLDNFYERQLNEAVKRENFTYHYPILKKVKYVYSYRIIQILVISLGSSYFLGLLWRIFTTKIIDWKSNEILDLFNGYDTFYSHEDYGWVDKHGQHRINS